MALREWLDVLTTVQPSESVLAEYETAVRTEAALAHADPKWAVGRSFRFVREVPAAVETVWSFWTTAAGVAEWWAPEHFTVAECELDPVAGGRLRIVIEEGDGTR